MSLLVDMRSIGTSYAGICEIRGVSTALEVWEENNLILIKYGGSIGEDSCGDCGSILFLGSSGSVAFSSMVLHSNYFLHCLSTT